MSLVLDTDLKFGVVGGAFTYKNRTDNGGWRTKSGYNGFGRRHGPGHNPDPMSYLEVPRRSRPNEGCISYDSTLSARVSSLTFLDSTPVSRSPPETCLGIVHFSLLGVLVDET